MRLTVGRASVGLQIGDLTQVTADALVNAANAALAGGGGVDGALHRAAGPTLMAETRRLYPEGCPTGSAVITSAGELPATFVIHAVGPVWQGGYRGEEEALRSAHRRSLELAVQNGCRSVAFPAISCGIYGYPLDRAAEASVDEVVTFLQAGSELDTTFVLFSEAIYAVFQRALELRLPRP